MPATLQSTLTGPRASRACATVLDTAALSETSSSNAADAPISDAVLSRPSLLRSITATRSPALAKSVATARPMPDAAPVTMTPLSMTADFLPDVRGDFLVFDWDWPGRARSAVVAIGGVSCEQHVDRYGGDEDQAGHDALHGDTHAEQEQSV